jgi:4-amino-4-deoxy-L-arabinose transferase-like glycosyltransferase
MDEPSVLDLLKEKLNLRNLLKREKTAAKPDSALVFTSEETTKVIATERIVFPWKSMLAVLLAIAGKAALDPISNNAMLGVFLFLAAGGIQLYSIRTGEWQLLENENATTPAHDIPLTVKRIPFVVFIVSLLLAFLALGGNHFSGINVLLWLNSIVFGIDAFWIPQKRLDLTNLKEKIKVFIHNPVAAIHFDYWRLLVFAAFCVAAFFHLHNLNSIPLEMTSDHAEKLLDISRVLNGETMIFFANNGGREPIHFYLAALLVKVFHAGMNFFTLKLAMALAFLLSLIYVYKLGKEIGTRWTGLFFMLIMGFAAWPNIIAHAGMRLILTPVFLAPTLFYFFRGLRTSDRNDFILTGIFLGLGMLGYTASRIVPILLVVGMLIYLIYQRFNKASRTAAWAFLLTALFAFVIFLPLFRYALEYPMFFSQRSLSRLTSLENPLPDNVLLVFLKNTWIALVMPVWKSGTAWIISVPERSSLDAITAGLYILGLMLTIVRWLKTRSWQDLFLLVSIPVLMLPSILALAFPIENPSQSRAGGAIIPIFLITAIALETLLRSMWEKARKPGNKMLVVGFATILLLVSARSNYELALVEYPEAYRNSTWNSSEMGKVVKDFTGSFGSVDNVWVVAKAYWVDTRLVAMTAGYVDRDFQIWPDNLESTLDIPGTKLFILKGDDIDAMTKLRTLYPDGFADYHTSPIQDRDFIVFMVPVDNLPQ